METEITKNEMTMKDSVLRKIDEKEVSMHSKKYFVLKALAFVALVVVVVVISAALFNFIFFNLRISQHGYLLLFGAQGVWIFLRVFPWLLLALDIVFLVFLESLLRNFRFAYRVPALYLLLVLLLGAAVLGFAIDRGTAFNDQMLRQADLHRLPEPVNDFYTSFHRPEEEACDCVITAIVGRTLSAYQQNDTGNILTITVPPGNPVLPTLSAGDTIFVAGKFYGGILHSFGLLKTGSIPASTVNPSAG